MTDRPDFEARLGGRLRARAAVASRPFDAATIARQAVAIHGRRRGFGSLRWPAMRPSFAVLIAALLLALAIIGVAAVGAILRDRPPFPPAVVSNGMIAVSANPWAFGGGENGDIYLVTSGAAPRRIIGADNDGVAQECPQFSPDGSTLAYGEARASGPVSTHRGGWPVDDRAIVVVEMSGDGAPSAPLMRVALPAGAGPMVCPEWSPTGRSLAFRAGDELWIADIRSGATRVFPIENVVGPEENELEWSREESMIAVAEPGQIRVIHVDGAPALIHVEGAAPRSLGWAADDKRIVYVSTVPVDEIGSAVRTVAVDGTNDVSLTPAATTSSGVKFSFNEAVVSPDGTRVAYLQSSSLCTADGCGPGPVVAPIEITDVNGANHVELTIPATAGDAQGPAGPDFFVSGVRWAPDGQRLILSSIDGVVAVGLEPGSPAVVYANGKLDEGLNLEWSWSQVTWQPTFR